MVQKMSAREARAHFADLLGRVFYTQEPVVVEKNGKPVAVVISPSQFDRLRALEERAWLVVDEVREQNASADPEDVLADVTAELGAVRQEMHDERTSRRARRR